METLKWKRIYLLQKTKNVNETVYELVYVFTHYICRRFIFELLVFRLEEPKTLCIFPRENSRELSNLCKKENLKSLKKDAGFKITE